MCDCLVALAPASGGATLFAKNSDRPPAEAQRIERFPATRVDGRVRTTYVDVEPPTGETVAAIGSRPEWMWGFEHGVNEAGVAAGNETIYTTLDPRPFPPALTGMDIVRLVLQHATTVDEAVAMIGDLLDRYGQGGSGHRDADRPYWSSFLLADPHGAAVVETSGREWMAERVDAARAISNRTTIPEFDAAHRHPRQPVETLVDPRWQASRAVLASPPVTVDALKAHLRSHAGGAGGWTVCMHVEGTEATTASVIAELGPGGPSRFLLGSPCTSVYVPLFPGRPLGEPVPWARFVPLTTEHRDAIDTLERGLEADARDDDGWAAEAWHRVDRALAALGL